MIRPLPVGLRIANTLCARRDFPAVVVFVANLLENSSTYLQVFPIMGDEDWMKKGLICKFACLASVIGTEVAAS